MRGISREESEGLQRVIDKMLRDQGIIVYNFKMGGREEDDECQTTTEREDGMSTRRETTGESRDGMQSEPTEARDRGTFMQLVQREIESFLFRSKPSSSTVGRLRTTLKDLLASQVDVAFDSYLLVTDLESPE